MIIGFWRASLGHASAGKARGHSKVSSRSFDIFNLLLVEAMACLARRNTHEPKTQTVGAKLVVKFMDRASYPATSTIATELVAELRPVNKTSGKATLSSTRSDPPGLNSNPAMDHAATQKKMILRAVTRALVGCVKPSSAFQHPWVS